MSERVCYIRRTDRGAILRGLRLVSGHSEDTWLAGTSTDPSLIGESVIEGARWVRDRLDASGTKSRSLAMLCLDPDGAVCSWVKPEDADPTLLDATISGSTNQYDPDSLDEPVHSGVGERFPKLPLELSFELLDADETSSDSRAAVMAMPDVPGRLLKDELDAMGIRIGLITSIWHTIANVWDPGSGHASHDSHRIVSSDSPIAAVLMIDHEDGRLIWSWSKGGRLIVGGSSRITTASGEHAEMALIRKEDIARICSDWLGWSSQLGISPTRVVCIGNPSQLQAIGEEQEKTKRGMSTQEIGAALSAAWPGATIDLIELDDPIGETLAKVATSQRGSGLESLEALSRRPVRAHRSMYRWGSLAMVMISAIIGLWAYLLVAQASTLKGKTRAIDNERLTVINTYDPQLVNSRSPSMDLSSKLEQMRQSQGPIAVARSKPILEELETLSYIFGMPGIEITAITLNNTNVTVTVLVENIAQAEQLNLGLGAIEGSHLRWRPMSPSNRGQKIQATYLANWQEEGGS